MTTAQLRRTVLAYYHRNRRALPWRQPEPDGRFDPYKILVSEIMLQQTQVSRVKDKYGPFLTVFPTVEKLAEAPLRDVIQVWSGLGYNRRAKYLWEAARKLRSVPEWSLDILTGCRGIGHNTAAAVRVYAYNEPHVFIETNIRTVYIHELFQNRPRQPVSDQEILPLLEATLDKKRPREFYWAMMDYGTHLKKLVRNPARHSRHYVKQAKFEGSNRQLRGRILRILLTGTHSLAELQQKIEDERLPSVAEALLKDGLIKGNQRGYYVP